MNNNTVIGIDLAKSIFQVATFRNDKISSNNRLNRTKFKEFLLKIEPTEIYMEACYSAHYWARFAEQAGHKVGLIPAQHVSPFTRGNKNDANDAVAIVEASRRPDLKLVQVKSIAQQDIQSLHRIRERLVRSRTGLMNQTRGLLAEYGVIFGEGQKAFLLSVTDALNDSTLTTLLKAQLHHGLDELETIERRIKHIEIQLKQFVEQNQAASILHSIPGIGFLNASALATKYPDPNQFRCAREMAVHLGLTPKLAASGNKKVMLGISKRGDPYLRKQLIHGARALMMHAPKRVDDPLCKWALKLKQRRGYNIATVALASRLARLAWTLLHKQEHYRLRTAG